MQVLTGPATMNLNTLFDFPTNSKWINDFSIAKICAGFTSLHFPMAFLSLSPNPQFQSICNPLDFVACKKVFFSFRGWRCNLCSKILSVINDTYYNWIPWDSCFKLLIKWILSTYAWECRCVFSYFCVRSFDVWIESFSAEQIKPKSKSKCWFHIHSKRYYYKNTVIQMTNF